VSDISLHGVIITDKKAGNWALRIVMNELYADAAPQHHASHRVTHSKRRVRLLALLCCCWSLAGGLQPRPTASATPSAAAAAGSEAIDKVLVHAVTLTFRQPVLRARCVQPVQLKVGG